MTCNALESHLDDEMLELFSLGRLNADLVEPVEEHILYCLACQDACACLEQELAFLRAALRHWIERTAITHCATA